METFFTIQKIWCNLLSQVKTFHLARCLYNFLLIIISLKKRYHEIPFVSGIKAKNLKKGMFFQPHPYVKLRIGPDAQNISSPLSSQTPSAFGTVQASQVSLQHLPHHGQSRRTQVLENTVDPTWDHEVCSLILFLRTQII